jgi:hypothetical protein
VIVCFVDISGIDDHHYLNFLFIIWIASLYKLYIYIYMEVHNI